MFGFVDGFVALDGGLNLYVLVWIVDFLCCGFQILAFGFAFGVMLLVIMLFCLGLLFCLGTMVSDCGVLDCCFVVVWGCCCKVVLVFGLVIAY